MAISNTKIQIKRSSTTALPTGLQAGELAYSFLSNTLFLGNTSGTGVVNIGGLLYTQTIDNATNANTGSTLVKRASDGSFAGQLYGTANLAIATVSNNQFSISGGDISASAQYFQGNNNVTLNASLNSIPGLTGGVYGSTTSIPVIGVAANGRVMNVSTVAISTAFTVAGNTGTATQSGANTFEIVGASGSGINTSITANSFGANVVISTDNTILRSNTTTGVGTVQTISTDLTVAGNLIVSGTQTYVNTSTVVTNDSLIKLAANNTVADVIDIGFYGESNTGTSVVYHGLIREGSGGTNAGDFYLFKNLAIDPTGNTVGYAGLTNANLRANIISSIANITNLGISGTANIATLGVSGVINTSSIGATTANLGGLSVTGLSTFQNTTMAVVNTTYMNVTTLVAASVNIGTLTYAASGAFVQFGSNSNTFQQVVIQNANTGTQASADFVVSTAISTDTTFYGDFGMNGPNFVGTGALNAANNVYLYSQNTDIAIGTATSNAIHFVVNSGATDAMTIQANGVVALGTALGTVYGGTGLTSATLNGIVYGGGTSAYGVTAAAGTSDQTWSNQILTVTNAGVPVWTTTMDGGTF